MADDDTRSLELQQWLQRFATEFTDRVSQATEGLAHSGRSQIRYEAMRVTLRYASAAMEIATGPVAEVNLLDMVVFVRVCRAAIDRHWIPKVFGPDGRVLAEVFARSEEELAAPTARTLDEGQRAQLDAVVRAWLAANPDQVRVEGIRLSDFASLAVTGGQAQGLMSSMKSVGRAANQALLLSERGLFLVHRLPHLWRLQARLGAQEILADSVFAMTEGADAPLAKATQAGHRLLVRAAASLGIAATGGGLLFWALSRARS